jgi:L-2,4-diaminobutyric acid acetyltransferase
MAVHLELNQVEALQPPVSPEIRPPSVADAAGIWKLVRDCGVLDENSCYAYLLICRDFAATSRVAISAEKLLGFVAAYLPPERQDVLFVWQVGVASAARGRGLGKALLRAALQAPACRHVRYLEATIIPSNLGSTRLFRSIAHELQADLKVLPGFSSADFETGVNNATSHEPEELIRIGPLKEQR